ERRRQKYKINETGEIIDFNYLKKVISLFQERMRRLSEIKESTDFFFKDKISFDKKLLIWKSMSDDDVQKNLEKCYKILENLEEEEWQIMKIREVLMKEAEKELDRGYLLWPLRVALTGKKGSPPPFEIAEILGKKRTLRRIEEAIELISK
ncbi:MAG: glutamate--tRNA ligase, partial [Parcubacteria group bacterium CG07_land_8_20_14_0_80_35_11]